MGKLFEDIRHQNVSQPGPKCRVAIVMSALSKSDQADLQKAIDDPAITGTAIYRALLAHGYKLGDHTIHRHRRKDCSCGTR